jgi:hypothetical protein
MAGHLGAIRHQYRHRLPSPRVAFQKGVLYASFKRLIPRYRNRPVLLFQKQVLLEERRSRQVVIRRSSTGVLITTLVFGDRSEAAPAGNGNVQHQHPVAVALMNNAYTGR